MEKMYTKLITNQLKAALSTRAELSIQVTRHVQHHAAQLGLRVQLITGKELDWVRG